MISIQVDKENLGKGRSHQDKGNYQLLSCGSGFKSYIKVSKGCKKSSIRKPSLLLVWSINQL